MFVYVNGGTDACIRCIVKSHLLHLLNEYSSFIVFNFENVHKIIFLCGNLLNNLSSISCRFIVELIWG